MLYITERAVFKVNTCIIINNRRKSINETLISIRFEHLLIRKTFAVENSKDSVLTETEMFCQQRRVTRQT